eukprot:431791_1
MKSDDPAGLGIYYNIFELHTHWMVLSYRNSIGYMRHLTRSEMYMTHCDSLENAYEMLRLNATHHKYLKLIVTQYESQGLVVPEKAVNLVDRNEGKGRKHHKRIH